MHAPINVTTPDAKARNVLFGINCNIIHGLIQLPMDTSRPGERVRGTTVTLPSARAVVPRHVNQISPLRDNEVQFYWPHCHTF